LRNDHSQRHPNLRQAATVLGLKLLTLALSFKASKLVIAERQALRRPAPHSATRHRHTVELMRAKLARHMFYM
jgi:hypothetical protein